ncbi:hypothetical protein CTA1_528 [Colletotrichum tanaceti]|uniref:Uncharacterized protein n=1 Tax=Colletotrichum tanaceti TaxID=1306861 RepID=A0A4U6XFT1_9PEZI|nr:hypothetical protein CTA1_528 [Colletotrichum tanaceti]
MGRGIKKTLAALGNPDTTYKHSEASGTAVGGAKGALTASAFRPHQFEFDTAVFPGLRLRAATELTG